MNNDRYNRWVKVSPAASAFEKFLVIVVQGLGRLDCQLIQEDSRFCGLSTAEQQTVPEAVNLTDRFTLSYLWVLGAYELVRTMSQRARLNPSSITQRLSQRLQGLKRSFERLRVPLAKMEPAKAHKDTDSPIAFPAVHRDLGVSWQLAANVFISRRELSDALLCFLEDLRAQDPHFPENTPKAG